MNKSLFSLSIHRPVLVSVFYIIIIVIGLISLWRLPIEIMPDISFPTISVICNYASTGPQEIEQLVTRPLESALAGIQGIEEMTATSSQGRSIIRVSFAWGTNLDEATNDIRDRLDRVSGRLPDNADKPTIQKFDISASPILVAGIESDKSPAQLRSIVEDQMQYRLERIAGVAAIDIRGGEKRQLVLQLDPAKLYSLKISPEMIITALANENKTIPGGEIEISGKDITLRTVGEFHDVDAIASTIVTTRGDVSIYVKDCATLLDTLEDVTSIIRINQKPGIQLSITKRTGANTVAVATAVKREMDAINRDFPGISLISLIDSSEYIKRSINAVISSLILGGLFAILVLLFFLRNIASTFIISLAIPISIIATFGLIYFSGNTLNLMTFGGLALGIGMLVDNAIVVLDNIFYHREKGFNEEESSDRGVHGVASAVIASTLTTIVVFFPVVFIRGMSGVLFQQLALVVTFSLVCSLLVALTLIPMLATHFLHIPQKTAQSDKKKGLFTYFELIFKTIESAYGKLLHWALHHRKKIIFGSFGLFVVAIFSIQLVGVELMPSTDESEVRVSIQTEVGTRFDITERILREIEDTIASTIPEVRYIVSSIGGGGFFGGGSHNAQIRIALVPKMERKRSSAQVTENLRNRIGQIAGATIRVRESRGMFSFRMGHAEEGISLEIRGFDLDNGYALAKNVAESVKKLSGVTDVSISRDVGKPEMILRIDRKKAADFGLSISSIGAVVQNAVAGNQATALSMNGSEIPVMVRFQPRDRQSLEKIKTIPVVTKTGETVELGTFVTIQPSVGPIQIERHNRERIITVSVNYTGKDLGSMVRTIQSTIAGITKPAGFNILVLGDYEEQQKSFRELMVGLFLAILLVYLVMAAQFESFRDPFIILFSIPVALIGVVFTLYVTFTSFTIQAFIGCIILVGIVVNNAIVLIDYINRLRRDEHVELFDAIYRGGIRRLRPILMTTSTTVLGLFPLALGIGEGGESQAPMGRVIMGGLLASTCITLLLIPVLYSLVEERLTRK
ncbi:MAG: efflux RND transporter permease subunit [Chitinivibrionales bacterium]|nr:efflux RND transporter permease subunit [Chitinivibrionales bacterium]